MKRHRLLVMAVILIMAQLLGFTTFLETGYAQQDYFVGYSACSEGTSKADILSNKTLTNQTGKVDNYVSSIKGDAAAKVDFDLLNPTNVRTYPNGTIVGDLPDGRTINLHPSSTLGGTPTVEIFDPSTGMSTKIRY